MRNATTLSQPKISESGRDENPKAIIVAEQERNDQPILEADATNDEHPIPDIGDESETDKYEVFQLILPNIQSMVLSLKLFIQCFLIWFELI